jgi:hypothetical protein
VVARTATDVGAAVKPWETVFNAIKWRISQHYRRSIGIAASTVRHHYFVEPMTGIEPALGSRTLCPWLSSGIR